MRYPHLPHQPHTVISYLRVGILLHFSLVLFILESYIYWIQLVKYYNAKDMIWTIFWAASFLFAFVHIALVIMDGWSRFQDYKKVKDLYFTHGNIRRISSMFMGSKCQRSAALVAADELGIAEEVRQYFKECGVRWHHYVPYFMIKDPLFLFRRSFWERTFLEKYYTPVYDFRKLQVEGIT